MKIVCLTVIAVLLLGKSEGDKRCDKAPYKKQLQMFCTLKKRTNNVAARFYELKSKYQKMEEEIKSEPEPEAEPKPEPEAEPEPDSDSGSKPEQEAEPEDQQEDEEEQEEEEEHEDEEEDENENEGEHENQEENETESKPEWRCFHFNEKHVPILQKERGISYDEARKLKCEGYRTYNHYYSRGHNENHRGCGDCHCCIRRVPVRAPWTCHHYNDKQWKTIREWDKTNAFNDYNLRRKKVCTNEVMGSPTPIIEYTMGRNENHNGCGLCHCCRRVMQSK